MTIRLPDLNVLIALAWPTHVHHGPAHRWFQQTGSSGWATCPLTQCGFVRLSSNPRIIAEAVSPQDALALLRRMVRVGSHVFWSADVDLAAELPIPTNLLMGRQQVTDAYLLALAVTYWGILSTLDRAILSLVPHRSPLRDAIELIDVG